MHVIRFELWSHSWRMRPKWTCFRRGKRGTHVEPAQLRSRHKSTCANTKQSSAGTTATPKPTSVLGEGSFVPASCMPAGRWEVVWESLPLHLGTQKRPHSPIRAGSLPASSVHLRVRSRSTPPCWGWRLQPISNRHRSHGTCLNEPVSRTSLHSRHVWTVTLVALCLEEKMSHLNPVGRTHWILSPHVSTKRVLHTVLRPHCVFAVLLKATVAPARDGTDSFITTMTWVHSSHRRRLNREEGELWEVFECVLFRGL